MEPPRTDDGEDFYVIRRGDDITIRVFNIPELDETTQVRPDGRLSVLLLDDVQAEGLTTRDLDALLTGRYAEFYRDPQVTVIVRGFADNKVFVGGEVVSPGVLPLTGKMTALAAVVQAGGFKKTAKTGSVILLRDSGEGQTLVQRLNLKEVFQHGASDVNLQPFDIVYVPMSNIAKVDKFVDDYIRQLLPINLTGGFTYIFGDQPVLVRP